MNFIIELIFKVLITNLIGLYFRYFFFKLIGYEKSLDYLSGNKDSNGGLSQGFFNGLIGVIIFALISVLIAYIVFSNSVPN
jgi:hypothetical protein